MMLLIIPNLVIHKCKPLIPAAHKGLFKRENGNSSSSWAEVGNDKSDMMGFTINPSKEGVM